MSKAGESFCVLAGVCGYVFLHEKRKNGVGAPRGFSGERVSLQIIVPSSSLSSLHPFPGMTSQIQKESAWGGLSKRSLRTRDDRFPLSTSRASKLSDLQRGLRNDNREGALPMKGSRRFGGRGGGLEREVIYEGNAKFFLLIAKCTRHFSCQK